MIAIPLTKQEIALLWKELLAKGGVFLVLILWVVYLTYQNDSLSTKLDSSQDKYDKRIMDLENKMDELQNDVIRENTKVIHEFNLKN